MKKVISGIGKFQQDVYPAKADHFRKLANGQSPEVLVITCADSRIDPNLITQTEPGELFICRNAGNIVPPYSDHTGGMTASIEFAVSALAVSHVVVCGHTDCGAMKGALNPNGLDALPRVKDWLGHTLAAAAVIREREGALTENHLGEITRENVKLQLQHLHTHPTVAAKLAVGALQLHGWVYDIETGEVHCHDEETDTFMPVSEHYASLFTAAPAVIMSSGH